MASFFPNQSALKYLDLSEREISHSAFHPSSNYVLYSNVFNDVTEEEWNRLEKDFFLLKEVKRSGVCFRLYRRVDRE